MKLITVETPNEYFHLHCDCWRVDESGFLQVIENHIGIACFAPGNWSNVTNKEKE